MSRWTRHDTVELVEELAGLSLIIIGMWLAIGWKFAIIAGIVSITWTLFSA